MLVNALTWDANSIAFMARGKVEHRIHFSSNQLYSCRTWSAWGLIPIKQAVWRANDSKLAQVVCKVRDLTLLIWSKIPSVTRHPSLTARLINLTVKIVFIPLLIQTVSYLSVAGLTYQIAFSLIMTNVSPCSEIAVVWLTGAELLDLYRTGLSALFPLQSAISGIVLGLAACMIKLLMEIRLQLPPKPDSIAFEKRIDDFFDLLSCTLVPMTEELIFRERLKNVFSYHGAGSIETIMKTALLFGLGHDSSKAKHNRNKVLMCTFSGFLAASLHALTGNLWAPVVAHVANNVFVILHNRSKSRA